jgi:hypothetical protein
VRRPTCWVSNRAHFTSPIYLTVPQALYPLLSQAATILPLVRGHLAEAAPRCSLPLGFSLDLVPILDEELLGYELTPIGIADTCLTLGCKPDGKPVLRKESLTIAPPGALQLVSLDGRTIARAPRELPQRSGRRDLRFPDWPSAAKFAWAELETLFPGAPRRPPLLNPGQNASLERALVAAATRLAQWNPIIHFCGLPNEEQLGYALYGADGGRGELGFRHPDQWTLRWKSQREVVRAAWSMVAPDFPLTKNETATRDFARVQHISAHMKSLK